MKFSQIRNSQCFTYEGVDTLVYFEDTQEGDSKRYFHSYKNGDLYRTSDTPPSNKDFYYCSLKGEKIPIETMAELFLLRDKLSKIKQPFINKLIIGIQQ